MSRLTRANGENALDWGIGAFGVGRVSGSTGTRFNQLQYPTDVVCLVVLWRVRYKLSLRDLPAIFLERGMVFTQGAVREWEVQLAPLVSETLRKGFGTNPRTSFVIASQTKRYCPCCLYLEGFCPVILMN